METLMAETMEMATPAPSESKTDWLTTLEDKVRAAADRIRTLNTENGLLRSRIAELEDQLAAASAATAASGAGAAQWEVERREIRERVERLTQHLEELAEL
jgi:predicted  nucleic acid-binding Zn-ribbon protein